MAAKTNSSDYPVKLEIDYPKELNRLTTFFRLFWAIPVLIVFSLISVAGGDGSTDKAGKEMIESSGGIAAGLFFATVLLILFRQRYPRWWFDFALELNRFSTRVGAYLLLLTDLYPSTVEKQSVQLDITYPDVKKDLNRWLPLVKWFLAIPHYLVLLVLLIAVVVVTIIAWFAILFTGRYPRELFDFVVGVNRWSFRVSAYAFLLVTDQYPPFRFK
ncbi:hypothetical protein A2707_02200 [Candidatus Saccharibacteria bacterium RIFCSPHIGHO2_01_FULL_45_15]|nr:MAG: hypothetical protein A2707_02200 [Candidatus Saccharibacteria bacterium RIFCSPHIGHO2_01_FULL_45_15]OGL28778.1 MAG: hypothetical protein A3C39_00030 [Candidatus Saccharibacteria bacterium RIFCSPHIGHO2_02_FULL_46_12]OGL31745.1 MAG: hypothetical protein A3E76_00640 [Candidatus Saccharibacteria bacterium RIFCSPHIGHO2_12_FULL_44_22]